MIDVIEFMKSGIKRSGTSWRDITERTGVSRCTLAKWSSGEQSPTLYNLEMVTDCAGYELFMMPKVNRNLIQEKIEKDWDKYEQIL